MIPLRVTTSSDAKGATIQSPRGGGLEFPSRTNYFFHPGSVALWKSQNVLTCLYRTVYEIYYLFHAESARTYLFKKYCNLPPASNAMLTKRCGCRCNAWLKSKGGSSFFLSSLIASSFQNNFHNRPKNREIKSWIKAWLSKGRRQGLLSNGYYHCRYIRDIC